MEFSRYVLALDFLSVRKQFQISLLTNELELLAPSLAPLYFSLSTVSVSKLKHFSFTVSLLPLIDPFTI